MKNNKFVSVSILILGLMIDGVVINLLIKLYQSSKLCALDPECMDESGMLYMIYYALLIIGTIVLILGIVRTIKSFIKNLNS